MTACHAPRPAPPRPPSHTHHTNHNPTRSKGCTTCDAPRPHTAGCCRRRRRSDDARPDRLRGQRRAAPPSTEPTLSDEPVTLSFTWWGNDARHAITEQLIAAFEAEHENITIEPQYTDWAGYWDKLATTVAAGDAPDIIQMDEKQLSTYAAQRRAARPRRASAPR